MILYIGICKQVTRKILGLINESGKVAGYKTNAQKSNERNQNGHSQMERYTMFMN